MSGSLRLFNRLVCGCRRSLRRLFAFPGDLLERLLDLFDPRDRVDDLDEACGGKRLVLKRFGRRRAFFLCRRIDRVERGRIDRVDMIDRGLHSKEQIERRIVAEFADRGRKIASGGGDGTLHQPVGMCAGKVDQGLCRLLGDPERDKARRSRDHLAIGADHRHMRIGIIKSLQHLGRRCA